MTPDETLSIAALLIKARRRFGPDGQADAEILLAHVLGKPRVYLHTWPERAVPSAERAAFEALLGRRLSGEPVAYLTGRREFWSLELAVSPATLIPRADTETLVAETLMRIPIQMPWRIADLGTGSGAIALALAKERPACEITATDRSETALAVAKENALRLDLNRIRFLHGAWFEPLAGESFHLIASNPPYIAQGDPHLTAGDLPFEPRSALVAGPDGLDDLRHLVHGAPAHLHPDGWLLLEHGRDQGDAVRALLSERGFSDVQTRKDFEGRDRVTSGCWRLPPSGYALTG